MTYTLTMFNTGQITLPKVRRSQYKTKNFTATQTENWLLIQPLFADQKSDTVFYESPEWFGIYSDSGIDPQDIILSIQNLQKHG